MRRIITACLIRCNALNQNLHEAADGNEALSVLQNTPIDCVIADWNMPNCDGLELLAKMRKMDNCRQIPFVMLTTENGKNDVTAAIRAGVSAYIVKPLSSEFLANKLNEVLS